MEIKLQYSGSEVNRDQTIYQILTGAMQSLRAFVEIYRASTPEAIKSYFEECGDASIGEIADELFLDRLDIILKDIDIEKLYRIDKNVGHLGSKAPVEKYWLSIEYFSALVESIKQHIWAYEVYTPADLAELHNGLKDYIGNLTYALACNAFTPYTNIDILETDEQIICDQQLILALATLYPNDENAIVSFAKELADLQDEFTISAPIGDLDPIAWEQMVSSCTPDISMQLADYDKYITSLDIRAFSSGFLTMDENFIDLLIERKSSVTFMGNVIPNAWANFVKLVPDKSIADFYETELYINQEEVQESLENKKLPRNFFAEVKKRIKNNDSKEESDICDSTRMFSTD